MIDLRKISGLPLYLKEDNDKLVFTEDLAEVEPETRRLEDMREVLMDKEIREPIELYYMYRDVYLPHDKNLILAHNLRYDIAVILPGMLGKEYMKSAGHYHPYVPGTDLTYPEVYEIIYGEAFSLNFT